ncbi:MAG: histidinol-phosphatase [Verrucomicrobiales bacterium]
MHTPLCRHAYGEPEEYAAVAAARGLKGIVFTCHSPMPEGWWPGVRMKEREFESYVRMVARAADAFAGQLVVRLGIESDWFPGMEKWLEQLHARAPLHHVLGSVHWFSPEYTKRFFKGDAMAFRRVYFEQLAESAESGLFDTLAHPDLIKNFKSDDWDIFEMSETLSGALDRIAKTGVAMELNTSGLHKSFPEMNPGPEILAMMRQRDIPVVVGSDAHRHNRVGADFEQALDLLEAAGYQEVSYFEARKRRSIPIPAARGSLRVSELA